MLSVLPSRLLYLNTNTYICQTRANKLQIILCLHSELRLTPGWFSVLCRSAGLSNAAWYRSNTLAQLQLTFTFLLSGKNHKYAVFDVFTARSAESGQVQVSLSSWMRVFFSGFNETGRTICFLAVGCERTAESWQWALLRRLIPLSQLYGLHLNIVAWFSSLA